MNPILPPVTSSSSSHLHQQYDDEMYSILPRIEIPDVLFSSILDRKSESTSSIDKGEPSLKHAHDHDTDHDANITRKKTKRQHHHDCVHSGTSMTHGHDENDKTMTNNSNSSAAEIDLALTSNTTATAAQDNANNTEELGIEMYSDNLEIGSMWQKRYDELIAFKRQHGHCNVPQSYAQNKPLGYWVKTQRKHSELLWQGKPSLMTAERQAALEKIDFKWSKNSSRFWQTRYDQLVVFKQQHGHCNVPPIFEENKPLGYWVKTQRQQFRSLYGGKPSHMTVERQVALEKIEFEWGSDSSRLWQTRYDQLVVFKQEHGHCNVPHVYAPNKSLAVWVSTQRQQFRSLYGGKPSHLTAERITALEKIEFEWSLDYDSLWQMRYDQLVVFKQEHGHCNVPHRYAPNKSLGAWVSTQRRQYGKLSKGKPSKLTAERQAALEKIGFEWKRYPLLNVNALNQQHGHCNVSRSYGHNSNLS